MQLTYKNESFCINYDWLQFSVAMHTPMAPLSCPQGYRLEFFTGTNVFRFRAILFDNRGRKWLTLLWSPYSAVLADNIMTVQASNELIYKGSFTCIMDLLNEITPCSFNSLGRLDICCDFETSPERLDFIKHLNSGHYYVQGKHEGSGWWHEAKEDGHRKKQHHCLAWGSKTSEIKVKLYHKSREQGLVGGDKAEKPWIADQWQQAGMDVHNIWRLEFSMSGAGQLKWHGEKITLEVLEQPNWVASVFFDLYHTRFVTRVEQGKKSGHHNKDKRVYLLDLPTDGEHLNWAVTTSRDGEVNQSISVLRGLLKQLENPFVKCQPEIFEQFATAIETTVRRGMLQEYFFSLFDCEVDTFLAAERATVGLGVYQSMAPPTKFMM